MMVWYLLEWKKSKTEEEENEVRGNVIRRRYWGNA